MTTPARPRVVFMGTPDLAREVLRAVAADPRWDVVLVVAQPDKPVGRGLQLVPPPVKVEALERGLPVAQPLKARDPQFLDQLRGLAPDVVIVAAYGQLLPPALLAIPRCGCLNVHTSILPRWRGAAPIQWAIASGDAETGVTLMQMDAGLDTGPMIAVQRTTIADTDTGRTLHDRLAQLGGELVLQNLPEWLAGTRTAQPQPAEGVTLARKLTREDGHLDWGRPAGELARRVRAFDPWPGAYTFLTIPGAKPALLKVWEAGVADDSPGAVPGVVLEAASDRLRVATGQGTLLLRAVQREGRRRMPVRDFLAAGDLQPGMQLG